MSRIQRPSLVAPALAAALMWTSACQLLPGRSASEPQEVEADAVEAGVLRDGVSDTARQVLEPLARRMGRSRYERFTQARLTLNDRWTAGWSLRVRRSRSPLPQDQQQMEAVFDLREDTARVKFVGGSRDGEIIGMKGGLAYTRTDGGRDYAPDPTVERYLRSVKRYFELPLQLASAIEPSRSVMMQARDVSTLEPTTLAGDTFDRVVVTPRDANGDRGYVAWISRRSGRVEWIELSEPTPFGPDARALHYVDYRPFRGALVPRVVEITAGVDTYDVLRRIEFYDVSLD